MSEPLPDAARDGPGRIEQPRELGDERFRLLCEQAPVGIFLSDGDGRDVYQNPAWLALAGLTAEEGEGFGWARVIHPDDREAVLAAWRRTTAAGGRWVHEYRMVTPRGELRWVSAVASPLRGADGKLLGYVGSMKDVTERKKAEAALRESEERLRQVVQNMPFLVVAHDANGLMAAWNRECERVTGYTAAEILGNPRAPELLAPDAAYLEQMRGETRQADGFRGREWRLTAKDGTERIVSFSNLSARFPVPGWSNWAVGVDVTQHKQEEAERRHLERKLQEAQKLESLGVLAGGVAHDFNNLLTGIIGYVSLALQQAPDDAALRVFLDRAVESAQRAAELCRQMLAYSGRGRFVVGSVDLSQAVRDLGALLKTSVSRKAVLSLELADDLPRILADASQIRQVLLNLVLNASESLGEQPGAVTVRTGRVWCDRDYLRQSAIDDDLPEGEYLFVEVADTGCGMDAETRQRIFEPFFTTKFTGRGLGLAAVLGIARGHHGAIRLASAPGLGTTVRVLFPPDPEATMAAPAEAPAAAAGGVVLFVDDEPALRDLAERALQLAGFQVLTAGDGREALAVFRDRAADVQVVVLDLTMPQLNGDEVLHELRRLRPTVRVILSSGFSEQEVSRRFTEGDLAGFLQKPYRPQELVEKVRAAAL